MSSLVPRVLGPLSFALLATAAACGNSSTSITAFKGIPEAGLGPGGGFDATVGSGDDAGGSGGSSGAATGDDSSADATTPGDDGSLGADAPGSDAPSESSYPDDAGDDAASSGGSSSGGSSSGSSGGGSSSSGGSSGGPTCPAVCHTNDDCANACPAVAGGYNCCDDSSATCFASQSPCAPAGDATPE